MYILQFFKKEKLAFEICEVGGNPIEVTGNASHCVSTPSIIHSEIPQERNKLMLTLSINL